MSSQDFMQCLQGATEAAQGIDFKKGGGYKIPLEDGSYNGMLTAWDTEQGEKDGKPWFKAQASFKLVDGPQSGTEFKDNPMWFNPGPVEGNKIIDVERLCRLASTIQGEECKNPPEAFSIIEASVNQAAIAFNIVTSKAGNISLYPNKRI